MSTTSIDSTTPVASGLLSRFAGVITAPRDTFANVAAHPKWLGMLALTTAITILCTCAPLFTEWGQQAALDQQVRTLESFGRTVDDEMYSVLQRQMRFSAYTTIAGILIMTPIMLLLISGILFVVFGVAMGGNGTFKQQFAVVVHSGVITALAQLFAAPLNYARGSMSSTTNLAVLLPMLEEESFAARLLGMVDLFVIWWVLVLAIGTAVLHRRRTQGVAIGLLAVYAVIALCIVLVKGMFGGGN